MRENPREYGALLFKFIMGKYKKEAPEIDFQKLEGRKILEECRKALPEGVTSAELLEFEKILRRTLKKKW